MSESVPTTVTLPATARKGYGRNAETTVTIAGVVNGRGTSRKFAASDAAERVLDILRVMEQAPAVVHDDDGGLWLFFPHPAGHQGRRLRPDGTASSVSEIGQGTPAERAASIVEHHAGAVRVL